METDCASRGWCASPTIEVNGPNTSALSRAATSTRYNAKKYNSRVGMDSMRSMIDGLGAKPDLLSKPNHASIGAPGTLRVAPAAARQSSASC